MNRDPRASISFAERGAIRTMPTAPGRIAAPGAKGRVLEHVLEVLLADEHRAHQRPEDDDPGDRGNPEDPSARDREVVKRTRDAPLAKHERPAGGERDQSEPGGSAPSFGNHGEVDREHERGDHQHREDAAEVVDRICGLVDVGRDKAVRQIRAPQPRAAT